MTPGQAASPSGGANPGYRPSVKQAVGVPRGAVVGPIGARYYNNPSHFSSLVNLCGRATGELSQLPPTDAKNWDSLCLKSGMVEVTGQPPRPDDFVVYEYNYGSKNRQHVGLYGEVNGKPVVISNGVKAYQARGARLFRKASGPGTLYLGTGTPPPPLTSPRTRAQAPAKLPTAWGNPTPAKRPAPPGLRARATATATVTPSKKTARTARTAPKTESFLRSLARGTKLLFHLGGR